MVAAWAANVVPANVAISKAVRVNLVIIVIHKAVKLQGKPYVYCRIYNRLPVVMDARRLLCQRVTMRNKHPPESYLLTSSSPYLSSQIASVEMQNTPKQMRFLHMRSQF